MILSVRRPGCFVVRSLLTAAVIAAVGCESATPPPAAPPAKKAETPEQRFGRIVTALKRWVESDESRVQAPGTDLEIDPGTPVTSWQSRVEHRLLKPAEPGGELRAEIAIRTNSTVSIVMPPPEEDAEEAAAKDRDEAASEDAVNLPPELRSLQQGPSAGALDRLRTSPIVERNDERVSRYELAFRNDQWELLTELDRVNEPFNSGAIEHAMKKQ
ncbi:MAG: hypothetical protein AAFV43_07130 [Planctomycetota bacterium]